MASLEKQLEKAQGDVSEIRERINQRNARRKIECASCGEFHMIKDLNAIQKHGHIPPRGCTEGDYWVEEELNYICPDCGIRNRLLFDNYGLHPDQRGKVQFDPEEQFKCMYKRLFGNVEDVHENPTYHEALQTAYSNDWVNNDFVDNNREKFGLIAKD